MNSTFTIKNGWLQKFASDDVEQQHVIYSTDKACDVCIPNLKHKPSPHYNNRPDNEVSLLVIHNISLPPGEFGSDHISDLFLGCLNPKEHECFPEIYQLKVAAHVLIRRDGEIIQYVPFDKRAWHAGISEYQGREGCNDFSIGIEMEGTDHIPYTDLQYQQLASLTQTIIRHYPDINTKRITGHCHIAPGRKTDPGESFDWSRYKALL